MGAGFYPRPWAVEPAATWAAPELHTRVFSAFELPTFKPAKRRATVKPELVGVAAWWAQVPASLMAKGRHWGETSSTRSAPVHQPFTGEQIARRHAKDAVAQYVALGHSEAWARWYVDVVTPAFQARKAPTTRQVYALFVTSGSGPAVDKIAKKYTPAKARKAG